MERIGNIFASLGFSPNFWTMWGLIASISSAFVYGAAAPSVGLPWYYATMLGGILLLISGFFDIVDGSVAKITKQSSKKGSFLDSSFDKISEISVFLGLTIGNLVEPILCIIALSLS
ncbi:MAG: CDP-alcohol phosphatidyltransferase family protein, partial [Nitrososphaeraceae archaeon]